MEYHFLVIHLQQMQAQKVSRSFSKLDLAGLVTADSMITAPLCYRFSPHRLYVWTQWSGGQACAFLGSELKLNQ